MKYKLIVSDIDGTLISSKGKISTRTKELVTDYQKKGGYFTIATGRMEAAIIPFIQELNINVPVIVYNGSTIINTNKNKIIYESKLEYNVAKTAIEICNDYKLDPILYLDKKAYICKMTNSIEKHVEKEKVGCVEVGNLCEFLKEAPTKILFIGNPNYFDDFIAHIQNKVEKNLNFICSESNYLELLPNDASKGSALQVLASYLNIPMEETIAIGDERNDVSMINVAGIGVAVKNARDDLIQKADYITTQECFQGVEEILYKVINNINII